MPNCVQGDLAWVTSESKLNAGKIVRCVRWLGQPASINPQYSDVWEVDQQMRMFISGTNTEHPQTYPYMTDQYLRPIRPTDVPDESLTWKEVPSGMDCHKERA